MKIAVNWPILWAMSGQSQLPLWVQYAQALGAPVLALVIGIVGAVLTRQQVKIAHVRLQHDLYDRRFAVFQAARKFLADVMTQGFATNEEIRTYFVAVAEAGFLFNDDIAAYLETVRKDAVDLLQCNTMLKSLPVGKQRTATVNRESQIFTRLMEELPVGLVAKFKPFLTLEK